MPVPPLPLAEDVQGLTPDGAPSALVRTQAELARWARSLARAVVPRRLETTTAQADVWARIGQVTSVAAVAGPTRAWLPPATPQTIGASLVVAAAGPHRVLLAAAPGGTVDGVTELVAEGWQELESDGAGGWHTARGWASVPIAPQTVASASTTTWRELHRWSVPELVPHDERIRTMGVVLRASDPTVTGARDVARLHAGIHRRDATSHVLQDYDGDAVSTGAVSWDLALLEAGTTLTVRLAVSGSVATLDAKASSTVDVAVDGAVWAEGLY